MVIAHAGGRAGLQPRAPVTPSPAKAGAAGKARTDQLVDAIGNLGLSHLSLLLAADIGGWQARGGSGNVSESSVRLRGCSFFKIGRVARPRGYAEPVRLQPGRISPELGSPAGAAAQALLANTQAVRPCCMQPQKAGERELEEGVWQQLQAEALPPVGPAGNPLAGGALLCYQPAREFGRDRGCPHMCPPRPQLLAIVSCARPWPAIIGPAPILKSAAQCQCPHLLPKRPMA